jgi:hypothetical protein
MAPGPFVPVPKFFGKELDGMCGLEMAEKAGFSFGDAAKALIPLVVPGRPPATSKAKLQFGHHVTPAIAKHHGASSLCYSADPSHLSSQLRSEALEWNPAAVNSTCEFQIDRLHALRSESVGDCLGVFQHWNPVTQAFGTPVLRVVACPAVATLGRFGPDDIELPGLNLQDAWDASLSPPLSALPDNTVSCPTMVSAGGFSHSIADPTLANLLLETEPLFIPNGEELAGMVKLTGSDDVHLKSWLLPAHSHLPVGMAWELGNLTVATLIESVRALTKKNAGGTYAPFIYVLSVLTPALDPWFVATQNNPELYAIQAFPFSAVQAQFPDLVTGAFPNSITCSTTLPPSSTWCTSVIGTSPSTSSSAALLART